MLSITEWMKRGLAMLHYTRKDKLKQDCLCEECRLLRWARKTTQSHDMNTVLHSLRLLRCARSDGSELGLSFVVGGCFTSFARTGASLRSQ